MIAKRWMCAVLVSTLVVDAGFGHGGIYSGRTPTPPGGGGGGGGSGPGPAVPLPIPTPGPATGGAPTGPKTGGGYTGPSTPKTPEGPKTGGGSGGPGPSTGGPRAPGRPNAPSTGAASDADPNSWESWWYFNKDRYLDLKSHVVATEIVTGSDNEFLGSGMTSVSADIVSTRVIPGLTALLAKDRQQDVVTGALVALARLADGPIAAQAPDFGRVFAGFTDDPNQEIAETSVLARGIVGDEASVAELVELLGDSEAARTKHGGHAIAWRTRAFAGYALGLIGAHTKNEDLRRFAVHHLVRTLREDAGATPDVQVACVTALGLTPLQWSKDGDDVHAPATPAAARKVTGPAAASRETEIECLLALLADTGADRWVRAHVPTALARLATGASGGVGDEITRAIVERLREGAREKDEVVQGCVIALGELGDSDRDEIDVRVRAVLENATLGTDQLARRLALMSLAQTGARAGESGTSEALGEVRQFLTKRLADGRSQERCWAALALGVLEYDVAHQPTASEKDFAAANVRAQVLAALRDSVSGVEVGALAISVGLMADKDAEPVLLAKLEHTGETATQGYLATALGLVGDVSAGPALRAQLATARFKPDLLLDTAVGLALLEDPTLVNVLIETLEKANSLSSQSAAASVLGLIGDRRTIDPLLTLVARTDVTAAARAFAAVALGRVCDQDRLPWNAALSEDVNYHSAPVTLTSADGTGVLDIL